MDFTGHVVLLWVFAATQRSRLVLMSLFPTNIASCCYNYRPPPTSRGIDIRRYMANNPSHPQKPNLPSGRLLNGHTNLIKSRTIAFYVVLTWCCVVTTFTLNWLRTRATPMKDLICFMTLRLYLLRCPRGKISWLCQHNVNASPLYLTTVIFHNKFNVNFLMLMFYYNTTIRIEQTTCHDNVIG